MASGSHARGLLDTNILMLRRWTGPAELPDEMAISTITLAELSAGPHEVRRNEDQGPMTNMWNVPVDSMSCNAPRASSTLPSSTSKQQGSTDGCPQR
jgi:hypothetical protein